ncbi:hypothetical protein LEN26_006626 [Aphanomyces euteiches]|nr:hypothetical protein LEN26_006626 [Aphanomyces euteiches]
MEHHDVLPVRLTASAIAASTAELATLPFDCSKVRMQTQGMAKLTHVQFNGGVIDTMSKIVRHEGMGALWNGARPAVVRQVAFYSVSVFLYAPLRDSRLVGASDSTPYVQKILAGGISGAIGIALANPLDVIKVKMQNDRSRTRLYHSIGEACQQLYRTEGMHGFLRGILPNMQRCFIVNGMEFGTYDQCKTALIDTGVVSDSFGATVGASLFAGFAGALASSPLDVIKTRLMAQRHELEVQQSGHHAPRQLYNGVLDCGRAIYQQQGIRAFYRGFTAYYLREAPWCCIFFVSYELARNAITRKALLTT